MLTSFKQKKYIFLSGILLKVKFCIYFWCTKPVQNRHFLSPASPSFHQKTPAVLRLLRRPGGEGGGAGQCKGLFSRPLTFVSPLKKNKKKNTLKANKTPRQKAPATGLT